MTDKLTLALQLLVYIGKENAICNHYLLLFIILCHRGTFC